MLLIPSSFIIFYVCWYYVKHIKFYVIHCEEMLIIEMEKITDLGTFLCLPLWKYCELSHAHITASFVSCYYYIEEQLGFYYQNNIWISIPFPLLLGQYLNFNSIPSNILFSLIFFPSLAVSLYMSVTKFSDTSFIDINFDQYQHFRCFHTWFLCHFPC